MIIGSVSIAEGMPCSLIDMNRHGWISRSDLLYLLCFYHGVILPKVKLNRATGLSIQMLCNSGSVISDRRLNAEFTGRQVSKGSTPAKPQDSGFVIGVSLKIVIFLW